jgi:hypothetical protein
MSRRLVSIDRRWTWFVMTLCLVMPFGGLAQILISWGADSLDWARLVLGHWMYFLAGFLAAALYAMPGQQKGLDR